MKYINSENMQQLKKITLLNNQPITKRNTCHFTETEDSDGHTDIRYLSDINNDNKIYRINSIENSSNLFDIGCSNSNEYNDGRECVSSRDDHHCDIKYFNFDKSEPSDYYMSGDSNKNSNDNVVKNLNSSDIDNSCDSFCPTECNNLKDVSACTFNIPIYNPVENHTFSSIINQN